MATTKERIAKELREVLGSRLNDWKSERAQLLLASTRIAELDALITYAETNAKTAFDINESAAEIAARTQS